MLIIKDTKGEGRSNWLIKIIIHEIQRLMVDHHKIQVAHIYWEGNGMADELAKFSHGFMRLVEWEDIPLLSSST